MIKKIAWQWESLDGNTKRAKVYGGWILHVLNKALDTKARAVSSAMVFVPDVNHQWTIVAPFSQAIADEKREQVKAEDFDVPG